MTIFTYVSKGNLKKGPPISNPNKLFCNNEIALKINAREASFIFNIGRDVLK